MSKAVRYLQRTYLQTFTTSAIYGAVYIELSGTAYLQAFTTSAIYGTVYLELCGTVYLQAFTTTMDFKPSVSVLFGHYSLPRRRILTKLGRTKFEKTT